MGHHDSNLTAAALQSHWMPFSPNKEFKSEPRMVARAEGMFYYTPDNKPVMDGTAGLWCVNAGHNRPRIVQAIQQQAAEMDYAPPFQMAHPKAFELADAVAKISPAGMGLTLKTRQKIYSVISRCRMNHRAMPHTTSQKRPIE